MENFENITLDVLKKEKIKFEPYLSSKVIGGIEVFVEHEGEDKDEFNNEYWMWIMWECFKAIELCYNNLGRFPMVNESFRIAVDDSSEYFIKTLMHDIHVEQFDKCYYSIRYGVVDYYNRGKDL